jgi:hypothetical protein
VGSFSGACDKPGKRSMGGCRYGWVEREREREREREIVYCWVWAGREREREREREGWVGLLYIRKCIKTVSVRGYPMLAK